MITRRSFFEAAGAGFLLAPAALRAAARFKIGVTDWNLRMPGSPDALRVAKKLGFEGVEVSLGRKVADGKLPLDNAAVQDAYRTAAREQKIALSGTCLDILHVNYLKSDPLGPKWVADGIRVTGKLDVRVMLMPFFGKGALTTRAEMDHVADILKDLARDAEKAKVTLGLENTISAEDNARIMDRAGSNALKVFYDVGNSHGAGFDPVKEIRWLGRERICLIHLKDNPGYMGEGKIDFRAVLKAMQDIGYTGFADLETSSPSKSVEADMARNLAYIRGLLS